MESNESAPTGSNGISAVNGKEALSSSSSEADPPPSNGAASFHTNGAHGEESSALPALLEGDDFLPNEDTARALYKAVSLALFSGEERLSVSDVCLRSRPMDSNELEATGEKEYRGQVTTYGKLTCDLTETPFWLPIGAHVPVVAFLTDGSDGDTTKIVHPRLVAAGPDNVKRALVRWLHCELIRVADRLRSTLHNLETLREADSLQPTWPNGYSTEPDGTYDVDAGAPVPVVDDETKPKRAFKRFNDIFNSLDS